jgi:chemotaxis protein MotB
MKLLGLCLAFFVSLATAGFLYAADFAQEQGKEDIYSEEQYHETQTLIDRMQAEINTINSAVSERDKEIEFLNNQIKEAIKFIGSGREDNVTLSENNEYLQGELKNVQEAQDELSSRLTEVTSEKEKVVADLRWEVSALNERLSREQETATGLRQELGDLAVKLRSTAAGKARIEEDLDEARQALSADKKTMESRLAEIAGLKRDIAVLGTAKKRIEEDLDEAHHALSADKKTMERRRKEIAGLKRDIAALETARAGLEGKVADMGLKLESAAERNARGLSTYRSEFFGRLREVFGDDPDIRMVGDRFVFQSEVLFPSVSAELNPDGQSTLTQLAETLKEVAKKIPADVNWMLRIDGHTDRVPIKTWAYESNWELSTARAMSVVKFLVRLGLAPEHLAATGFGEYRALDPRDDEIAYRHNRRIEFKLTQ